MDPDPICPERLDTDPVNIRPDPQHWRQEMSRNKTSAQEITGKNKKKPKKEEIKIFGYRTDKKPYWNTMFVHDFTRELFSNSCKEYERFYPIVVFIYFR